MREEIIKILSKYMGDKEYGAEVYIVDVDTAINQTADAADAMVTAFEKSVDELKGKQQFK